MLTRSIIGLDFGTTTTVVAKMPDDPATPRDPEVVEVGGRRETESALRLDPRGATEEFGLRAWEEAPKAPDRTYLDFKPLVGGPVGSPSVGGGAPRPAAQLAEALLRRLVVALEAHFSVGPGRLGEVVARTIIGHPAGWPASGRDAIVKAARAAGFPDVRASEEPRAALKLAEFRQGARIGAGQVYLVYDFGGGTSDVWVARGRPDGTLAPLAQACADRLGGRDLDSALQQGLAAILAQKGVTLTAAHQAELRIKSRRLKEDYSQLIAAGSRQVAATTLVLGPGLMPRVELPRDRFEAIAKPLMMRFRVPIDEALKKAGIGPGEVDWVLTAGGSSRLPYVAEQIRALLPRVRSDPARLIASGSPQDAVARGLALIGWEQAHGPCRGRPAPPPSAAAALSPRAALAAQVVRPVRPRSRWIARHRWAVAAFALLALLGLVGAILWGRNRLERAAATLAGTTEAPPPAPAGVPPVDELADVARDAHAALIAGKARDFEKAARRVAGLVAAIERDDHSDDELVRVGRDLRKACQEIAALEEQAGLVRARGEAIAGSRDRFRAPFRAVDSQGHPERVIQKTVGDRELQASLAVNALRLGLLDLGQARGRWPGVPRLHEVRLRVDAVGMTSIAAVNAIGPRESGRSLLVAPFVPFGARECFVLLVTADGLAFNLTGAPRQGEHLNIQWTDAPEIRLALAPGPVTFACMDRDGDPIGHLDDVIDTFQWEVGPGGAGGPTEGVAPVTLRGDVPDDHDPPRPFRSRLFVRRTVGPLRGQE